MMRSSLAVLLTATVAAALSACAGQSRMESGSGSSGAGAAGTSQSSGAHQSGSQGNIGNLTGGAEARPTAEPGVTPGQKP